MVGSLWDNDDAERWHGDLGQRVYTSRLLGRDPDLVLHGGGNTSVKTRQADVFGEEAEVLLVKGSGADLAGIDESGFACLRLGQVARLAELEELSDTEMAKQLLLASTTPGGPAPSVEAILHAIIPAKFVDHTHADAVVTVTNSAVAAEALEQIYGDEILVVPYVMPGFLLARECARILAGALTPRVAAIVLVHHGIFTWGETAQDSYEAMIRLVSRAEDHLARIRPSSRRPNPPSSSAAIPPSGLPDPVSSRAVGPARRNALAALRRDVSLVAGAPMVVSSSTDPEAMGFVNRSDLNDASQRGPATPDHVIRTKATPLVGRDVDGFAEAYRRYFDEHRARAAIELRAIDPAPRVILDPELGLCCVGRTAHDALVVEDIYRHTMKVISDATALGGYVPVGPGDLFDVEYWDLEQAKLRRKGSPPPLAGEVALVTGAAGGIGRACVAALLAEGAAVGGLDVAQGVAGAFDEPGFLGVEADVTDDAAVETALSLVVDRFGGVDVLVLNAGIFKPGITVAELDGRSWRETMSVNLDANVALLRMAHPLLAASASGGRVVVVGSKTVAAPGPGAAAYSASKAALTQLARVAALEWGGDGIRVNVVHPGAIFDTAVWPPQVLADRAARYGLTVEDYRRSNVLGVEVSSEDVARLVVAMCGPAFARTTGAQVPIDGGNQRVI